MTMNLSYIFSFKWHFNGATLLDNIGCDSNVHRDRQQPKRKYGKNRYTHDKGNTRSQYAVCVFFIQARSRGS